MNAFQIDVIIAVYNGSKFIEAAIASIQAQTYRDLRIIVADDGSADNTTALVEAMAAQDHRIQLLKRPHAGVSATLNAAIAHGTAPFIAFLDADDLWDREKLAKQLEALHNGAAEICFCLVQEFETFAGDKPATYRARTAPLKGHSKISFLGKRQLFDTYGGFDEQVAMGDFVEWYSRVIRAGQNSVMLNEVLAYRRVHEHNTTRGVSKNAFLGLIKAHLDEKRKHNPHTDGSDR